MSEEKTGSRRQAREFALQVSFLRAFNEELSIANGLQLFKENFDSNPAVIDYTEEILRGIESSRKEIDNLISSVSSHWRLDRLSLVDLCILRVAVFEIQAASAPPRVALNEAVEMAKRFSSQDSFSFINGVLDQIVKELGHG